LLSVRNTIAEAIEETPGENFSAEAAKVDALLQDAMINHNKFMEEYIKNVGRE
jgi:hypothetical protein